MRLLPPATRRTAVVLCLATGLLAGCGAHKEAQPVHPTTTTSTTTTSTTTTTVLAPTTTLPPRPHRPKRKPVKPKVHSSFTILPPLPAGGTTTTTTP
jgi:hypothetical protein